MLSDGWRFDGDSVVLTTVLELRIEREDGADLTGRVQVYCPGQVDLRQPIGH